jgi:hypothetical protein
MLALHEITHLRYLGMSAHSIGLTSLCFQNKASIEASSNLAEFYGCVIGIARFVTHLKSSCNSKPIFSKLSLLCSVLVAMQYALSRFQF